ncbi:hypothetical protein LCGC14_2396050 [marine sediment metagenome]|uniref:Uncharacterized protein n=1 Tax=marine sediment metagenome TaxID=412755 RepID=A0A0F9CIU8_9ZZZZ
MSKIRNARRVIRDAFAKDPDFRHGYQANIAMAIYDQLEFKPAYLEKCNEIADSIIKLIFESGFDDEDNKPTRPTPEFIDGLTFATIEVAQKVLDTEYPGYTIEEDNGLHIVYDPNHISYAAIQATRSQCKDFWHHDHETKKKRCLICNERWKHKPVSEGQTRMKVISCQGEKFEGYDHALKDLVE